MQLGKKFKFFNILRYGNMIFAGLMILAPGKLIR